MVGPRGSGVEGRTMVLTLVQARMGSTRFPGKVMEDLDGKPMVRHVLERAAAITGDPEGTILVVSRRDTVAWPWPHVFRGGEDDVLGRLFDCAQIQQKIHGRIRAVIRITADCPLLDSGISRLVLDRFFTSPDGMTATSSRLDGLDTEVLSLDALQLAVFAAMTPEDREHVTPWLKRNTEWTPVDVGIGRLRWSVDTPEDLEFVRAVYRSCPACRDGVPHHTNAGSSIGGNDRHLVLDLHQADDPNNRGGLIECQAADLLHTRMSE